MNAPTLRLPRTPRRPAAAAAASPRRASSPAPRAAPPSRRTLAPRRHAALRVADAEALSATLPVPAPPSEAAVDASGVPFTLAQLATLRAVTTAGSIDRAADAWRGTKRDIGKSLAKLEAGAGFPLFAGGGRGGAPLRLTPAGALLDRYAERVLALAADAAAAATDAADLRTGEVFVAASQTVGVYALPPAIERFRARHPGVAVSLQVENTRRCCAAVASGAADVAVVGGAIPSDLAPSLRVTHYADDEVVLVVPPAHPLAGAGVIDPADMFSLRYVSLHKSSTVAGVRALLEAAGIDWRALAVVLEVNSVEAIKSAVEAGMGAAFLSAASVRKEDALGVLAPLRVRGVPLVRALHVVTDPARYLPRAARQFAAEACGLDAGSGGGACTTHGAAAAAVGPSCARFPHLAPHRSPPLAELGGGGAPGAPRRAAVGGACTPGAGWCSKRGRHRRRRLVAAPARPAPHAAAPRLHARPARRPRSRRPPQVGRRRRRRPGRVPARRVQSVGRAGGGAGGGRAGHPRAAGGRDRPHRRGRRPPPPRRPHPGRRPRRCPRPGRHGGGGGGGR